MNDQVVAVCPQCGSAAAVHSIEELAALARGRLGGQQQGYAAEPQSGQVPGWAAEPQTGPVPGPGDRPGWAAAPQSGPVPAPGAQQGGGFGLGRAMGGDSFPAGDDLAGIALNAATKFIGRSIGRRVQRAMTEQVLPAVAARQEAMLREQIAIAERHPDLRACLTDNVIFLAGGSRALPMPNLAGVTVQQADALVASLRDG